MSPSRPSHQRLYVKRNCVGFTAIELLVTIGVVGLLIALLLPAVQRARESARRVECVHNLKQLALAVHNYEGSYRRFPGQWAGVVRWPVVSVQAVSLPYLDGKAVYDLIDFSETNKGTFGEPPSSGANWKLMHVDIPVFRCPSDNVPTGGLSYRGCLGTSPLQHVAPSVLDWRTYPAGADLPRAGIFYEQGRNPAHIVDGLSNTAFFSERVVGDLNATAFTPWRDVVDLDGLTSLVTDFPSPDEQAAVCASAPAPPATTGLSYAGATWLLASRYHSYYNHVLAPNSRIVDCTTDVAPGISDLGNAVIAARSLHPGGVNLALGDGAVRFVSQSIDLSVWRGLASISGGEVLGDF